MPMVSLGSVSVLCGRGECVGVREGEYDGHAVCTFRNTIEVYNLHDHRCIHSWPLGSTDHVTCPAHFQKAMGMYCAIRNGNELMLWRPEDKYLSSLSLTLPSSPHSLLTPSHSAVIIVDTRGSVFMAMVENGEIGMVSEAVEERRRTRGRRADLLYCALRDWKGTESVIVVRGDGGRVEVGMCEVKEGDLSHVATAQLTGESPSGQFVCCGDKLIAAGSDGHFYAMKLSSLKDHQPHIATHRITASPTPLPVLIAGISPDHFAVLQPGGVVSVWDTVYGTCQVSLETNIKKISTLDIVAGHLVFGGEDGVRVCHVMGDSRNTLATALGQITTPPQEAILVAPQWVAPDQDCKAWAVGVREQDKEEREVVDQLCDPLRTPTLSAVDCLLPSPLPHHSIAYQPVARRLLRETKFWAHSALASLVSAGVVTGSLAGEMMEKALERQDWALILLALHHSADVPEAMLISLLQQALQLPEQVESHSQTISRDSLIWSVLALPFNDSLVQQPLSEMPLSSVLLLLQFIAPHISMPSILCPSPHLPLPYASLLDWLAVILDTHWMALTLSSPAKSILSSFKYSIFTQMVFLDNLSLAQSILESGTSLSSHRPNWLYRVDTMDLHI